MSTTHNPLQWNLVIEDNIWQKLSAFSSCQIPQKCASALMKLRLSLRLKVSYQFKNLSARITELHCATNPSVEAIILIGVKRGRPKPKSKMKRCTQTKNTLLNQTLNREQSPLTRILKNAIYLDTYSRDSISIKYRKTFLSVSDNPSTDLRKT